MTSKTSTIHHYLVNMIQKLTIYETYHSFYIVGSNSSNKSFKVIKIDRLADPKTLSFSEDLHEYDLEGIHELISMINIDNKYGKINNSTSNNGIIRTYQACALIGFVRFLEGYYMVLITKQLPVAILGYHVIYTIEDFTMIYIPYINNEKNLKEVNLDEQNYTYDLTNTLQYNQAELKNSSSDNLKNIGIKNKPCKKFCWNDYLLRPIIKKVSYKWLVYLVHGYLAQSSLNIFGCSLFVTMIARRSSRYAGTRFLKRGGTNEGYVANEVETEQIVHNASISSFDKGKFTSFVHVRGSIPLFWSQDPKQVPKPPINIDIVDPFATVCAHHFKQLLSRFGGPIVILNLVKMREKKAQESILANEFKLCVDYLKQFLPNDNFIEYICFDMAKFNKTDKENIMNRLYDLAEHIVGQTSFYRNFDDLKLKDRENLNKNKHLQNGVARVNCVDCLDRTNTAMYVIGKCAFAHQLFSLGILSTPKLGDGSVCERMLIELYEKCGDAIAQQYAGSQLVHRVDTYGKNSLASQSRDMIHTISRYYSNAFADADKQNAINVFLGVFEPSLYDFHIWELQSDSYLHDTFIMRPWKLSNKYIEWIDNKLFKCLPNVLEQEYKTLENFSQVEHLKDKDDPRINAFDCLYRTHEFTPFHEIFYFNSLNSNIISNNIASGSFGGNLISIFDPFKNKKKNSSNNLSKTNNQSQITNVSAIISSDEDFTDDSYTYQDIVTKPVSNKEKVKAVNYTSNNNYNLNFEVSEKSMNIYKKYAEESINHNSNLSTKYKSSMNKSFSNQTLQSSISSSYSIISTASLKSPSQYKNSKSDKNKFNLDTFFLNSNDLNCDPMKKLNEKDLSIYLTFLNVGLRGANQPTDSSIKCYESYINKRKMINIEY